MIRIIHIDAPLSDKSDGTLYILVDADPSSFVTDVLTKIDSAHHELDENKSEWWTEDEKPRVKVPLHRCKFETIVFPQELSEGEQFNIYAYNGYMGFVLIRERKND